jgi:hypothetical protein
MIFLLIDRCFEKFTILPFLLKRLLLEGFIVLPFLTHFPTSRRRFSKKWQDCKFSKHLSVSRNIINSEADKSAVGWCML